MKDILKPAGKSFRRVSTAVVEVQLAGHISSMSVEPEEDWYI